MGNKMGNINSKSSFSFRSETFISKMKELDLKAYSDTINVKLRQSYFENYNNKFNVSISLDKKDFNAPFAIKKYSVLEERDFIPWKDYFRSYLVRQIKKGFDWASELLE